MSTKASSSARTTTLPPVPLTTPFERPSSCGTGVFTTVNVTFSGSSGTIIASDPKRDASCMPKGWDNAPDSIVFRPGVCPQGWTAYNLKPRQYSTATCCSRDFTLEYHFNPVSSASMSLCVHNLATTTANAHATTNPPINIKIHDPWIIEWSGSEAKSLTPSPPSMDFCQSVVIRTWVPGSTAVPSACEDSSTKDQGPDLVGPAYITIWMPILAFLFICGGCYSCHNHKRQQARPFVIAPAPNS